MHAHLINICVQILISVLSDLSLWEALKTLTINIFRILHTKASSLATPTRTMSASYLKTWTEGVVCRDGYGMFSGASARTISGVADPTILEVMVCSEALTLAGDLWFRKLPIASDCLGER